MAAPAPTRGGKRRLNAEMNVVPYIDVMLVLLIIFMVTAPLLTQGIEVELPKTQAGAISKGEEPTTLSVDRAGKFYLNRGERIGQPLEEAEVLQIAGSISRNKPEEMFLVEGDSQVPYQYVARAMSLLQEAGVKRIGFVTDPVDSSDGKKKR